MEYEAQYNSNVINRLLKYTRKYLGYIILCILLLLAITACELYRPILVKRVIDRDINGYRQKKMIIIKDKYYSLNGSAKFNYNKGYRAKNNIIYQAKNVWTIRKLSFDQIKASRKDDIGDINKVGIIFLILIVLTLVMNYFQILILQYTSQKIIYNMRQDIYEKLMRLSLKFYDKYPVGRIVTRATNDTENLNELYTDVILNLFKDFFMVTGTIIAMMILNMKIGLIVAATLPLVIISTIIFRKIVRRVQRKIKNQLGKINGFLSEHISGIKIIKLFGKEKEAFQEFGKLDLVYANTFMKQTMIFGVFRPFMEVISALALSLIFWYGGIRVLTGEVEFGVLYAFVQYIDNLFKPISDFAEKFDTMQSAMASGERIFELLDEEELIKEVESPIRLEDVKGRIEFKHVYFAYDEENWVLKDVSFTIEPGETAAFVGATGAGKTSIISLINRYYDIQKGEILIDGKNIKDVSLADLRKNIGQVLQDVVMFSGDIKYNINLGNNEISFEDLKKSSKYVNADKFIERLPNKYDESVAEGGVTLSAGQRQLLSFARALSYKPKMLILDEATANIDTETENLIQEALNKITKDMTLIVIAHRLSTIQNADKIIVMHKGRIREIGNHQELLKKRGLYYDLYQLQYENGNSDGQVS